jgi:hypothetical protein
MSVPTGIDSDAPIRTRREIDINAPLGLVWRRAHNWPIGACGLQTPVVGEVGRSLPWRRAEAGPHARS